jgi:hypothetical protein
MSGRCPARRSIPPASTGIRITVVLAVDAHPMVELTVARTLMILLEELRADKVPVRQAEIGLSGGLLNQIRRPPEA